MKYLSGLTDKCKVPVAFAYMTLVYIIASLVYLIVTMNYGTPFKDNLKKYPKLLKIKMEAVRKRKNAFIIGLIIGILLCVTFKPFHTCLSSYEGLEILN